MRDSNPRYQKSGIPDFESSAFDHSANLPLLFAKLIILFRLRKNIFRYLLVLCTYNRHISVIKNTSAKEMFAEVNGDYFD